MNPISQLTTTIQQLFETIAIVFVLFVVAYLLILLVPFIYRTWKQRQADLKQRRWNEWCRQNSYIDRMKSEPRPVTRAGDTVMFTDKAVMGSDVLKSLGFWDQK